MSAHVLFPALDPTRPGTLSAPVLTRLVRGQLGFDGLLVSDDLGMKALADRFSIAEIVTEGFAAGLDHFIIRGPRERQVEAWEALVGAVERSPFLQGRLAESRARLLAFKNGSQNGRHAWPTPAPAERLKAAFPWPAHQELAGFFRRVSQEKKPGDPDGSGSGPVGGPGASPVSLA